MKKLRLSEDGKNVALIFALANTAVNQTILEAIYAKTFGYSPEECGKRIAEFRKQTFERMLTVLEKYGDLDVPAFREFLGLSNQ